MGHNHNHIHNHNHNHSYQVTNNIKIAFLLNFGFAIIEIFGGLWTNSLAIVSDAIHDLGDSMSLGLAWYLEEKSHQTSNNTYSYGYRRLSLLAALINTLILLFGSVYVISEAIPRIIDPEPANAKGMILFAILGIIVNGLAMIRLFRQSSFNASVIGWHLLEDLLGWIAVLIVSITLFFTNFYILDPILSILISAFILYNAIASLRKTIPLFLQAAPNNIDISRLEASIVDLDKVDSVHHTHVWSLDGEHHVLTTHVVAIDDTSREDIQSIKSAIRHLGQNLNLEHITVEIEYLHEYCANRDKVKTS